MRKRQGVTDSYLQEIAPVPPDRYLPRNRETRKGCIL